MDKKIEPLLTPLTLAHRRFIEVAGQLAAGQRYQAGVCGEWSPKDVVAHLVGWDASLKALIVAPDDFEPPYNVDHFNARSVAARQTHRWEAVLAEMVTNFTELKQALATVEAEMEIYRPVIRWLPGRRDDYELHTGQLEAWLASPPK